MIKNLVHGRDGFTGTVKLSDLDTLKDILKTEFLRSIKITEHENDEVNFVVVDKKLFSIAERKIRFLVKSRISSINRIMNKRYMMFGMHVKSDVLDLYEAQEGKCYYSGETIMLKPKSYQVDHIVPIAEGGSDWPINLALVSPKINQRKHSKTKAQFLRILAKEKGVDWRDHQKAHRKRVDLRRKKIDRLRRNQVLNLMKPIEKELKEKFPANEISYGLDKNYIILEVDGTEIYFFAGFVRDKRHVSVQYLSNIIQPIIL